MHYILSKSKFFEVHGKDATRYLNARLTNSIIQLPIGCSCLAAALTPQGKTEGVYNCLRLSETSYLLQCDGGERDTLNSSLKRYIVADRVSVQYPEKGIIAVHGNSDLLDAVRNLNSSIILPEDSHREMLHYISDDASGIIAIIPRRRLGWDGFDLWILESSLNDSSLAQLLTEDYRMTEFEFELERLKFGMPQFPIEINDSHLLTESPVDHMVSHSKGCYVGQEVIERIASRGSTPRSIARFRAVKSPSLIGEIDENRERTSDKLKLVTQVDQPENCEQTDLQYGTPIEILRNIEDYMKSDARQEGSSTADGIDLLSIEKRWEKVGEVYSSIATESEIYGFAALKKDLELPKDLQISKDMKASFSWISN